MSRPATAIMRDLLAFMVDHTDYQWPDVIFRADGSTAYGCETCGARNGVDTDHRNGCKWPKLIEEARAYLKAHDPGGEVP